MQYVNEIESICKLGFVQHGVFYACDINSKENSDFGSGGSSV